MHPFPLPSLRPTSTNSQRLLYDFAAFIHLNKPCGRKMALVFFTWHIFLRGINRQVKRVVTIKINGTLLFSGYGMRLNTPILQGLRTDGRTVPTRCPQIHVYPINDRRSAQRSWRPLLLTPPRPGCPRWLIGRCGLLLLQLLGRCGSFLLSRLVANWWLISGSGFRRSGSSQRAFSGMWSGCG